ncbi:MAG: pyridoxal-phosphate dependent enzyme [Acidimicrobiales bacterium]
MVEPEPTLPVSAADVAAAAARLRSVAHRTPVVRSSTLDEITGARLFLKVEAFQRTGSFKFRGAYNAVACLSEAERAGGVAAFSSGNHAQAVALAARIHDVPAVILMPADAPPEKLAATRGYGAEVVLYNRYEQDRDELGSALQAERGLPLVKPFDDPAVIAGQGTAVRELLEEVGDLDAIVVPVGGGGLISGSALAARDIGDARVIGVEPAAGDDVRQSLAAGRRVEIEVPRTIADGQQTTAPGLITLPIIEALVEAVVTVTDAEIVDAMRLLHDRCKLVIEPSGATGVAALLSGLGAELAGLRVGVVVSGGNISAQRFAELLSAPNPTASS